MDNDIVNALLATVGCFAIYCPDFEHSSSTGILGRSGVGVNKNTFGTERIPPIRLNLDLGDLRC